MNTEPSQANVLVDGILRGAAPQEIIGLSPGQHRLRIEKEGYGPVELTVSVNAGNEVSPQYITLSPTPSPTPGPTAPPPEPPETLFARAEALRKGDGVPKDLRQAFALYLRAAELGFAPAQHRVGAAYALGEGVEQNDSEAVAWYKKAAEQGLAEAQYDLGVRYVLGRGVQQDVQAGMEWYRKAAAQGHQEAIAALKERNPLTDQIRRFVEDHLRRRETGDMDGLIADYGEQVDYQGEGRVNRDSIRNEHIRYFRDHPERHYQILGKGSQER